MATKEKSKKKPSTKCKCIALLNEKLTPHNTTLDLTFTLSGGTYIRMATTKIDTKKRGEVRHVVCAYCPCCGKKWVP